MFKLGLRIFSSALVLAASGAVMSPAVASTDVMPSISMRRESGSRDPNANLKCDWGRKNPLVPGGYARCTGKGYWRAVFDCDLQVDIWTPSSDGWWYGDMTVERNCRSALNHVTIIIQ